MSKILIETRLNSLKLNENHSPRKGCLGRIEGICADFANPTRNGRFYSRELWERVFNDDLIKESLESKTLIGELDHPEDRFEPLAKEACVVMTDYTFDDDKKVVYGGFDILDTPAGRILKSLLDYGCVMGVSSRGQGDIVTNSQYEEVAPETYEFACFDVVTTPAVATARQHVTESAHKQKIKGLNNTIIEQVNSSTTNAELDTILRVVESTGLSNIAAVKDAIRNKRKSIIEGKTISEKQLKDLQEAKKQIEKLEEELNSKESKTITELNKLRKSTSNLSSQVLAYKHRENKLIEKVDSLQNEITSQKSKLRDKRNEVANIRKEISNIKSENESLKQSVLESMEKYNVALKNEASLKKQIKESNTTNDSLKAQISKLEESKDVLTNQLNEKICETKDLKSKNSRYLTESKQKLSENSKLLKSFRDHYVNSICEKYGVDATIIHDSINESYIPDKIEKFIKDYVDKVDRYSMLPFSAESSPTSQVKVLSENLKSSRILSAEDRELEKSQWFMETVAGIN